MQKLFFIHKKKDTFKLISNFDFDQNQLLQVWLIKFVDKYSNIYNTKLVLLN